MGSFPAGSTVFPQSPAPKSVNITSLHQTNQSIGHNLSRYVADRGGHRWKIEAQYAPLSREDFSNLWAFIVAQRGRFSRFDYKVPGHELRGAYNPTTHSNVSVISGEAGRVVTLDGFGSTPINNLFKAGDFIRFSNFQKSYMVTSDASSTNDGQCVLNLEPAVIYSPLGADYIYTDATFSCAFESDEFSVSYELNRTYGFTLKMFEVLI